MASNPYTRSTLEGHTLLGNVFTSTISLNIAQNNSAFFNVHIPSTASIVTIGREIVSNSADGFEVRVYSNPTNVALGSTVPNKNTNMQSSKTSTVSISTVNSYSTTSTEVDFSLLPAGGFKSGGSYPSNTIRIYAPGEYFVGVKNLSINSSATVYITYTWIQVTDLTQF